LRVADINDVIMHVSFSDHWFRHFMLVGVEFQKYYDTETHLSRNTYKT